MLRGEGEPTNHSLEKDTQVGIRPLVQMTGKAQMQKSDCSDATDTNQPPGEARVSAAFTHRGSPPQLAAAFHGSNFQADFSKLK